MAGVCVFCLNEIEAIICIVGSLRCVDGEFRRRSTLKRPGPPLPTSAVVYCRFLWAKDVHWAVFGTALVATRGLL